MGWRGCNFQGVKGEEMKREEEEEEAVVEVEGKRGGGEGERSAIVRI